MTATVVAPAEYRPHSQPARHYPQLDGLRAVAILLVLWQHAGNLIWHGWGSDGVRLFFVLSAYLITGILLPLRGAPRGRVLKAFYCRRALRLLPAFYVVLALVLLAKIPPAARDWPYHLLYVSNWRYIATTFPASLGHLWTLAIEEQFYLVWPIVALTVAAKRIPRIAAGAVVLAIISRAVLCLIGQGTAAFIATTSSLDALGLGALLAWHMHERPEAWVERQRWITRALFVGILCYVISGAIAFTAGANPLQVAFDCWGASFVAVWAVDGCVERPGHAVHRVLTLSPMRALGRVSYAVYLFHVPFWWVLTRYGWENGPILFLIVSIVAVAYAAASWQVLESPINALKHRLPYR